MLEISNYHSKIEKVSHLFWTANLALLLSYWPYAANLSLQHANSRSVVADQHNHGHLRAGKRSRFSGPTPNLLNQELWGGPAPWVNKPAVPVLDTKSENDHFISSDQNVGWLDPGGSGSKNQNLHPRTPLMAQWLRIRLPMQETRVWALGREDTTCRGATKSMCHNYLACALEPMSHNYWALVPQLLKPTCLEPVLRNKRSHHNEKPTHHNKE